MLNMFFKVERKKQQIWAVVSDCQSSVFLLQILEVGVGVPVLNHLAENGRKVLHPRGGVLFNVQMGDFFPCLGKVDFLRWHKTLSGHGLSHAQCS